MHADGQNSVRAYRLPRGLAYHGSMRPLAFLSVILPVVSASMAGCHSPAVPARIPADLRSPFVGYSSATYARDAMWLCRPGKPGDVCASDLTATEIHPDGSQTVVAHQATPDPKVDCFYVYPTVDVQLTAANHTDFSDLAPMRRTVLAQAARFGEVCAVYAPLYRQATIGTYFAGKDRRESFLQTAYSDVLDAFLHYMGQHNRGRKVVLIGHSQGADMISRLLRQVFDHDPAMRERLMLAMPVGGPVEVPNGKLTGGSFDNIPLCSRPDETGCVVAFRTFRMGGDTRKAIFPPPPGHEPACVNPVEPGSTESRRLSRTYYPVDAQTRKLMAGVDGVTTPFVLFRGYYDAACMTSPEGYRYLGISAAAAPGEKRVAPVDLEDRRLNRSFGTHVLDMQFTQGDLVDLVGKRIGQ